MRSSPITSYFKRRMLNMIR